MRTSDSGGFGLRPKRLPRRARHEAGVGDRNNFQARGDATAFRSELERSRRYGRAFALLAIRTRWPSGDGFVRSWVYSDGGLRAAVSDHLEMVKRLLRAIDDAWRDGDFVYVLLPESDHAVASGFLARLERERPGLVSTGQVSLAIFPTDGVTSGALLNKLHGGQPPALPTAGGAPQSVGLKGSGHEDGERELLDALLPAAADVRSVLGYDHAVKDEREVVRTEAGSSVSSVAEGARAGGGRLSHR